MTEIERRLARVESRLVQLMLFLGAKPEARYGEPKPRKKVDVLTSK